MGIQILTRKDELMILAILRLGSQASLVKLKEFLTEKTGKSWSVGNVFVTLDKLENAGLIRSELGEPSDKPGGKAVKTYSIAESGLAALRETRNLGDSLWAGLDDLVWNR